MTRSEIFTAAHKNARNNKMWQFRTYREKLAYELRRMHNIARAAKLKGRKVEIIAEGSACFGRVCFIDRAFGNSWSLVDSNGQSVWNCGTRTGNWKPCEVKLLK